MPKTAIIALAIAAYDTIKGCVSNNWGLLTPLITSWQTLTAPPWYTHLNTLFFLLVAAWLSSNIIIALVLTRRKPKEEKGEKSESKKKEEKKKKKQRKKCLKEYTGH